MNIKLSVIILLCLISARSGAQITLTQSSYPGSMVGTDSLRKTVYNSVLPSLAPATNGIWDLSTVTDSVPDFFIYRVPTTPYQFADSNNYYFSTYLYQGNVQSSVGSSAFEEYGINVLYESYLISAADSIFIPTQTIIFTSPRTVIKFPATFNTSWSSTYSSDFNYQITYAPIYTHAPGIVRTYYTETDTVVGWGKMRLKDPAGSPTAYMEVLQVQTIIMSIDTFLLNGLPAPAPLLSALNIQQGHADTTYQVNFYRTNEVTPLAQVNYSDAAFTHITGVTYHRQRLPNTAGSVTTKKDDDIVVYPDPVYGSAVYLHLPAAVRKWDYELCSLNGNIISSGRVSSGADVQVALPASITSGTYYLRLMNESHPTVIKIITVAR